MRVRFFGVRGSTPVPGSNTARYGGNTSCVEVTVADGTTLIFDAGTGIRELGKALLQERERTDVNLLLSHLHWDHILGIPFFGPLWRPDTHVCVYPLATDTQQDAARRRALFDGVHFPVRAADIPAKIDFADDAVEWRIGSARVRRIALNHPGGAQGFRVDDADGKSLAYLTDNEISPPGTASTTLDALAKFADGANVIVHDTQYVKSDMPAKRGWGHSTLDDVLALGKLAGTPHLVLFHHDPDRDDDALDALGRSAKSWLTAHAPSTRASVAYEGWDLSV